MCRALEELEQALIVVKNMLRKGLDMKEIAEMTEVSLDMVRKVKGEFKG